MRNFALVSKEATFFKILPKSAYITDFIIEMKNKNFTSLIESKEEAKKKYNKVCINLFLLLCSKVYFSRTLEKILK